MADTYIVNGVNLMALAWRITTAEGLQDGPELRGEDPIIPSMHGALDMDADLAAARRRYDPGTITFSLWVKGVDPVTGLPPSDPDDLSAYEARVGELQRLFNARGLDIVHPRSDGARRCRAKLAKPLRPVRQPASPWFGVLTAECTIPAGFWTGPADVTVSSAGLPTGGYLDLSAFAGCDAPIADGLWRFGPGANPAVSQGGTYCRYDGVVPAGKELVIDCSTWKTSAGAGGAWSSGPVDAQIASEPGPSWFELDPTAPAVGVTLTHTGGGLMAVSYTARPKYLTS